MKSLDSSSPIVAVLCDFGISRVSSGTNTGGMIGTPGFIAPEILMERKYDISADVSRSAFLQGYVLSSIQHGNHHVGSVQQKSISP